MKRFVRANSQSALLYFEAYQVDNIGELVADNLTHKYRSEGADFHYVSGKQGYDYNDGTNSITIRCRVSSHFDPEINKNSRYGAYLDSMDFKEFEATQTFRYNRYDTQDSMGRQLVIILTDDIEDQIFKAVNGDIEATTDPNASDACDKVTASISLEDLGLEPRQRTAVDGKTWWVVYDTVARKYLDTIMYFGKYKTKKDCQYAIDRAIEKYGDDLNRTIRNHRKYFSNPGNADKVTASTNDSDIVNTIYSVMMNYEYGYDPDMTDINSMLQELTNKGVHVDTSDAFKRAWVSAHNKAERKTWGDSGDSYHYDSLTPRELEAIENYDTEYWEYVKDHPFNLKPASAADVTSSTKYTADMCSVGASDEGFEQLAEGDDTDTAWAEPKYHASSYYGKNYSGLEDDFATDDPSALVEWIWDHAANGGYIEVDGPKDRIRLDPDDLAEQVELGGIDEYGIISQIDNV